MYYNGRYPMNSNDERFGFLAPFLLGGLVGGAAVGVSRPRPVYVNPAPYPYPPYYGPGYGPGYGPRPPYYY